MAKAERICGLVLAGGKSRRMGRDKALLLRDGRSQLRHAVELLQLRLKQVFVSARADQADEPERSRYDQIIDRYDDIGPVAGILSALETHPDAGWVVLACDLPNVNAATIDTLLDRRSGSQPFTAFASSYDQLPEPLCAFYAPGSLSIVRQFVSDGIVCPRKILLRSETKLLRQPHPSALDNINTPEDLAGSKIQEAS